MRRVYFYFLLLGIWGCGDADSTGAATGSMSASTASPDSNWRDAVSEIMDVEGLERHAAACDFLTSRDVVQQLYSIPSGSVTYRPMTMRAIPHAHCSAIWAKPNKAELEEANKKLMTDYGQRKVKAMLARKPFDEAIPKPVPGEFSISITFASPMFDSSEEAITTLKSRRKSLAEGIDVKVMGETQTIKMDDIQEWIDDIGDGGTWAPKGNGLSVVHQGVILTVTAEGFGDSDADRARTMELANYVIGGA